MHRRDFLAGTAGVLGTAAMGRAARAQAAIRVTVTDRGADLLYGDRTVAHYIHEPVSGPPGTGPLFTRGGYIHPLHAPNGAVLTDDFPADHPHQRGVFFAWTKTRIGDLEPDFWNLGSGTGRIRSLEVEAFREEWSVGFRATHLWEMRRGDGWEPALDEQWQVLLHPPTFMDREGADSAYVLDLTTRQTPRVDILLPVHRYGGMAVRGSGEWNRKNSPLRVLTSEGKNWSNAENTRARWADQSGPLGNRHAGVALLEHPDNLRAPNLLRVPPEYPYVVYCPSKGEPLTLQAGKTYTFRYRLVTHNGPANPDALNREWERFKRQTG